MYNRMTLRRYEGKATILQQGHRTSRHSGKRLYSFNSNLILRGHIDGSPRDPT